MRDILVFASMTVSLASAVAQPIFTQHHMSAVVPNGAPTVELSAALPVLGSTLQFGAAHTMTVSGSGRAAMSTSECDYFSMAITPSSGSLNPWSGIILDLHIIEFDDAGGIHSPLDSYTLPAEKQPLTSPTPASVAIPPTSDRIEYAESAFAMSSNDPGNHFSGTQPPAANGSSLSVSVLIAVGVITAGLALAEQIRRHID